MSDDAAVECFCLGDEEVVVATLHRAVSPISDLGVVFVVGGYQSRTGAHRQFWRLARSFAARGFPCLRFDAPGLGDSSGEFRAFDDRQTVLRRAIEGMMERVPEIRRVVLWGLCDGASAAVLQTLEDDRIAGLILVNPWGSDGAAQGRALKNYYLDRLLSWEFWRRFLLGGVNVFASLKSYMAGRSGAGNSRVEAGIAQRMLLAMQGFSGPVRVVIADQDMTGQIFLQTLAAPAWRELNLDVVKIPGADHVFARREWHQQLEAASLEYLQSQHKSS